MPETAPLGGRAAVLEAAIESSTGPLPEFHCLGRAHGAPAEVPDRSVLTASLDDSTLLAFVADEEMRYVAVNDRVCEVLGYSHEEILRMRNIHEFAAEVVAGGGRLA